MIKQLGFISVAALSLAALSALSACDGQPKPPPAPTETKAVAPQAVETLRVDPEAKTRFEMMSGRFDDFAPVTNAPAQPQVQVQPANAMALDEQKLKAEAHKAGALPQLPVTMSGGVK